MRPYTSPDSLLHYMRLVQQAASRAVDLTAYSELDTMLKGDAHDVVALLGHDALFKGGARVGDSQRVPLINALAILTRNTSNEWIRIQGCERLRRRLKTALDLLPSVDEKAEAEVDVRVIMGYKENFIVVQKPAGRELYGVVRLAFMR